MGKGESDLKRGHVMAQNECDRLYHGAFDHIRAECVCMMWPLCLNKCE
jgi:hypothetical protein